MNVRNYIPESMILGYQIPIPPESRQDRRVAREIISSSVAKLREAVFVESKIRKRFP